MNSLGVWKYGCIASGWAAGEVVGRQRQIDSPLDALWVTSPRPIIDAHLESIERYDSPSSEIDNHGGGNNLQK